MATEAAQVVSSVRGRFLLDAPRTQALGEPKGTTTEDISREALQAQLTKLEQIVEYLKVLYR